MERKKEIHQYIHSLGIGFIISVILYLALLKVCVKVVHSLLEIVCAFIAVAIFLIVWNTMDEISDQKHFLGFAILPVLIFNICHIYVFAVPLTSGIDATGFVIVFSVLARLTEVVALYIISLRLPMLNTNKWICLFIATVIPFAMVMMIINLPFIFPDLLTGPIFTLAYIVAEMVVIINALMSFVNLKGKINNYSEEIYRYLLTAPFIIVAAQIMFILSDGSFSISWMYEHVLKIIYYYYLYKSVFVSYVKYPYKMMKDKNKELEEAYHQLELSKQEEARKQNIMLQQEKLALLGQMGAGIVHETRNYLSTIKGSCQIIEVITKESNILKHVSKINKSVDLIDGIISKFLFMSKPRETTFEEMSICDLAQSIESLIVSTPFAKKVGIIFNSTKEERYLLCDEGQINQVVLNLCKNAVEAMEDTEYPRLEVETGFDEDKNEMYIKVIDNGKGMSEEELRNIGNAFYTTKKSGTGLGLYLCNQIVKEHKGTIEVESEPGKGTSFTVWLPCIEDEDLQDEITNDII